MQQAVIDPAAIPIADLPLSAALRRDLRSDHAGETGAVWIYRGILAVSRDPAVQDFARRHLATETRHLDFFERSLPPAIRSRALPLWRLAGWLTGALPALFGARAVWITIAAVEDFVDRHYAAQIEAMTEVAELEGLRRVLADFRGDELDHRDDARARTPDRPGPLARLWAWMIGAGSAAGVALARTL